MCCRSQEDALIATQFQTAEMIDAERARVQMEMTDEVCGSAVTMRLDLVIVGRER